MLVINKGAVNKLVLNLTTKKTTYGDGFIYVFLKLTNDMTKQEYYVYPVEDVKPRLSVLSIEEGVDITLGAIGFYTYVVYLVDDNTLIDDSTLNESHIIERGKVNVTDTASPSEVTYTEYTPTDNANTLNNNTQYISI